MRERTSQQHSVARIHTYTHTPTRKGRYPLIFLLVFASYRRGDKVLESHLSSVGCHASYNCQCLYLHKIYLPFVPNTDSHTTENTHSPTGKAFIQKRKSCTKNKCINYLNAYARVQKIRFYTLIVIVVCAEMISISYVYTVIKIVFVALIRGVVQQCRERCFTNGGKMGLWS